MKIIDLLNKIANEEEIPMKIKLNNEIYNYRNDDFKTTNEKWLFSESYTEKTVWLDDFLKLDIEIIEEDKPLIKPLEITNFCEYYYTDSTRYNELIDEIAYTQEKIQEIIEYINKKRKN